MRWRVYGNLVWICAHERSYACICIAYRTNERMCVFILVIGMLFSFSNFLYPYGHQICFDERILSHTVFFQSMCKCRHWQAKCIHVSAPFQYVCKRDWGSERGRNKSAQSIFIYFIHIDFLLVDFNSLFTASINTYWSVYSHNKIHLTSNECRSIPGLNDFSENLASHWTAPDLHAVIFLHLRSILCGRLFYVGSRLFSLFNLSIESLFHEWRFFISSAVAGKHVYYANQCLKTQWRQRYIRLLNFYTDFTQLN